MLTICQIDLHTDSVSAVFVFLPLSEEMHPRGNVRFAQAGFPEDDDIRGGGGALFV